MKKRRFRLERLLIVIVIILISVLLAVLGFVKTVEHILTPQIQFDITKFKYKNGLMYYDDDEYESITGIDVCSFQKDIDWTRVKNDGIQFAIIRCGFRDATDGTLYLDPRFDEYARNALDAGVEIGIYFYSSAITMDELIEEAQYVEDLISTYDITYPIAYDMEFYENGRLNNLSVEDKTSFAMAFCDYFNQRGYQTLIYGNIDWLTNQLDFEQIKDSYKLWYAAYLEQPQLEYPFSMWQYSSMAKIDGIEGNVDINIYLKEKIKEES